MISRIVRAKKAKNFELYRLSAFKLKTAKDRYLIPKIDDVLDALGKARIFLVLDVTNWYHKISVRKKDNQKLPLTARNHISNLLECFWPALRTSYPKKGHEHRPLEELWNCAIPCMDDIIICLGWSENNILQTQIWFWESSGLLCSTKNGKMPFL